MAASPSSNARIISSLLTSVGGGASSCYVVDLHVTGNELGVDDLPLNVPYGTFAIDGRGTDAAGVSVIPIEGGGRAVVIAFAVVIELSQNNLTLAGVVPLHQSMSWSWWLRQLRRCCLGTGCARCGGGWRRWRTGRQIYSKL